MSAWLPKKHCHSSILVNSVLVAVGGCTLAVGITVSQRSHDWSGPAAGRCLTKAYRLILSAQNLSESFVLSQVESV